MDFSLTSWWDEKGERGKCCWWSRWCVCRKLSVSAMKTTLSVISLLDLKTILIKWINLIIFLTPNSIFYNDISTSSLTAPNPTLPAPPSAPLMPTNWWRIVFQQYLLLLTMVLLSGKWIPSIHDQQKLVRQHCLHCHNKRNICPWVYAFPLKCGQRNPPHERSRQK